MIKLLMEAGVYKFFSISPQMEKVYRILGNKIGKRKRLKPGIPTFYYDRIKRYLNLQEKYNIIHEGDKILEVGTGWLHWDSIAIRLFFNVEATLFDLCDNRQLQPLKQKFSELTEQIDNEINIEPSKHEHVHDILRNIASANSFDDLYRLLGFRYVIDNSGKLSNFQDESFSTIYSGGVLEHVHNDIINDYIKDFYRLLKPGGYCIHSITINDHYTDRTLPDKYYLTFSDKVWKRFFENKVQYINRLQRSEWLNIFQQAGFELIDEESSYVSIEKLKINKKYMNYDKKDLECLVLRIVHRKPL